MTVMTLMLLMWQLSYDYNCFYSICHRHWSHLELFDGVSILANYQSDLVAGYVHVNVPLVTPKKYKLVFEDNVIDDLSSFPVI